MLKAIQDRRSVRFYREDEVTDEQITEVLEAGFAAPSAHGKAPWHAIVIKDKAIKERLSTIHHYTKLIARAPVVIAVCADPSGLEGFWIDDTAAFMENMLIQASSMGLGSCWVGIHDVVDNKRHAEQVIREACELPDNMRVLALTPLGYAARYPGPHAIAIPEGRVHFEVF